MVSATAAVLGYAVFSAGLLYGNIDEGAAASLYADKLPHLAPAWPSSVGPAEAEAMRSTAGLVIAHFLNGPLTRGLALCNFLMSMYAVWAYMTKEMFLGKLSIEESAHLTDRLVRYVMIKAVFMGAVVDAPDTVELCMWLAWFSVIAYMKCFVGLARDRSMGLMASPSATAGDHLRTLGLLCLILSYDLSWVAACASAFPAASVGQLFLWLHDTALILIEAIQTLASYAVHVFDRCRAAAAARGKVRTCLRKQEVVVWEGRGAFLYNVDMGGEIAAQALTLAHLAHIWARAGLHFSMLDLILFMDIRASLAGLCRRVRACARHRAAARALRESYPDAHPAALAASGEQCAICRDTMQTAKELPCGHMFHEGCLRDWLQSAGQTNFSCPICRASLFPLPRRRSSADSTAAGGARECSFVSDEAVGEADDASRTPLLPRSADVRLPHPQPVAARRPRPDPQLPVEQPGSTGLGRPHSSSVPAAQAQHGSESQVTDGQPAAIHASSQTQAAAASDTGSAAAGAAAAAAATVSQTGTAAAAGGRGGRPQSGTFSAVQLSAAAQQLLASTASHFSPSQLAQMSATAAGAESALRAFAARLAAGRVSAARQANRLSAQLAAQLSAAMERAGEALLDAEHANDISATEMTDSGALATRLLEACLHAGLGLSEFDEALSDEIASVASDDDPRDESGGNPSDYQEQLEELRRALWGHALALLGGAMTSGGDSGGSSDSG